MAGFATGHGRTRAHSIACFAELFQRISIRSSNSHYVPGCGFAASAGRIKRRFCGNKSHFSSVQQAQVGKSSQKSLKQELLNPQPASGGLSPP
jgi:hypothetical protein